MIAAWPIVTAAAAASGEADANGEKLRHALAPGREWTYRSNIDLERESIRIDVEWKIYAIGREPDGSWLFVIQCDMATKRTGPPPPAPASPPDRLAWRCRMFEDGTLVGAQAIGPPEIVG